MRPFQIGDSERDYVDSCFIFIFRLSCSGSVYGVVIRVVELNSLSQPYWDELIADEYEPFGSIGANLVWREKTRNVGVREDVGRLVAAAGTVLAEVTTGQESPF